ncbi:hypothetical protein A2U01_0106327 [Trifolium medium]|uniref:Uncharacterized protein n=1 Tax=Trifolium medium TaxID=97028 RepID=A0A392V9P9_9FABA|nr:hypothetical protein [Trifolium medium]
MRLPEFQEKQKNGLFAVNCARLGTAEPGAENGKNGDEVAVNCTRLGTAESGAGA